MNEIVGINDLGKKANGNFQKKIELLFRKQKLSMISPQHLFFPP